MKNKCINCKCEELKKCNEDLHRKLGEVTTRIHKAIEYIGKSILNYNTEDSNILLQILQGEDNEE